MSFRRAVACAFLLICPVWLALPAAAAAQSVTTDVNADGLPDRIDRGASPTEIVVWLSNGRPHQRLRAAQPILDFAVADVDRDGDSDLVATTFGSLPFEVHVWTNAGHGRFVPRPRDSLPHSGLAHRRLGLPGSDVEQPVLWGDGGRSVVLPASVPTRCPSIAEPLAAADVCVSFRVTQDRPTPRGPPSLSLLS
jgi:hypothetical protein